MMTIHDGRPRFCSFGRFFFERRGNTTGTGAGGTMMSELSPSGTSSGALRFLRFARFERSRGDQLLIMFVSDERGDGGGADACAGVGVRDGVGLEAGADVGEDIGGGLPWIVGEERSEGEPERVRRAATAAVSAGAAEREPFILMSGRAR